MIRCALVAGIGKAFRCRRFDSLAVGGDCPADCPAQPDGNRIADLFVFVQQTAFDHPIVGKFLNPFVFLYGQGPVFRRVRQFRCGHGGMGDYRGGRRIPVQPSVKTRFPTAQMVGVSHGFRLEFFGQIPPVFPRFQHLYVFQPLLGKVDVVASGRIQSGYCIPESPPPFKPEYLFVRMGGTEVRNRVRGFGACYDDPLPDLRGAEIGRIVKVESYVVTCGFQLLFDIKECRPRCLCPIDVVAAGNFIVDVYRKCGRKQPSYVFYYGVLRLYLPDDFYVFQKDIAPLVLEAEPFPGRAECLAGRPADDDVDLPVFFEVCIFQDLPGRVVPYISDQANAGFVGDDRPAACVIRFAGQ